MTEQELMDNIAAQVHRYLDAGLYHFAEAKMADYESKIKLGFPKSKLL